MYRSLPRPLAALADRFGSLGRNLGWNLFGQFLPMVAGVVCVPLLIHALGTARFGFLSLVWVLIGYFSLFDLGLSRALTQRVATLGALADGRRLQAAVATGMALIAVLAAISVPLLFAAQPLLLDQLMHIPPELAAEGAAAFPWLACGVPVVIVAAGVRGILEGEQRFAAVNIVRTPAGIAMFAAPWAATLISPTLQAVTAAVFLVRIAQLGGFAWLARRLLAGSIDARAFDRAEVRLLFGFGLWMTVSNLISPLLVYLDRFAISRYGNLSDVAYYSTPFELIARLLFIGQAVSGVMFPLLSAAIAERPGELPRLMRQNYLLLLGLIGPVTLVVVLLAKPGLTLWLGAGFAAHSTPVLQILAVGVLLNSLASVPFGTLQAMRRPDLTAKIHLVELPLYLLLLAVLLHRFGIVGAAAAWTIRVGADWAAIAWMAARLRRVPQLVAA